MDTKPSASQAKLVTSDELVSEEASPPAQASPQTAQKNLALETKGKNTASRSLILLVVVLVSIAYFASMALTQRFSDEALFRRYVEKAQIFEMKSETQNADNAWARAIALANRLGDNDKAIADLYVKKATLQSIPPRPILLTGESRSNEQSARILQAQADLKKALNLYQKSPFTTLEQIRTTDLLLDFLSTKFDDSWGHPYYTNEAAKLMRKGDAFLNQHKIELAIEQYDQFLDLTHSNRSIVNYHPNSSHPQSKLNPETFSITESLSKLETQLKPHDQLLNPALKLMHDLVYYAEPFRSDRQTVLETSLLDKTIAKSSRDPDNLATRLLLADQAFARQEFRTASVEYTRCLGIKENPAWQSRLQECYRRLHKPAADLPQTIAYLLDLRRLQTDALGRESSHVRTVLRHLATAYLAAGDFAKAEELGQAVLVSATVHPSLDPNDLNGLPRAYESLMEIYVIEGKLGLAKDLNKQAEEDRAPGASNFIQFHYTDLCLRAGWMREYYRLHLPSTGGTTE